MEKEFGNAFRYKDMRIVSNDHIVYTGVRLSLYLDWDSGDDIEAVFNPVEGTLFFQEWMNDTNIWNKSPILTAF